MPSPTPFRIVTRHGDLLRGDVHLPARTTGAPVVLLLHGFKGFKDWGFFPWVADALASHGFVALRFNFTLNGVEEEFLEFTALDRFARNTPSRELDDVADLIAAVAEGRVGPADADRARIGLLGHSMGGGVTVVTAAEQVRVAAAVTWAGVSTFDRWGRKTKREWRRAGVMYVLNARTQQQMPLSTAVLDDLEGNAARLHVLDAARRMTAPLLLVHGTEDLSVPLDESRAVLAAAGEQKARLIEIPRTGHTFDAGHPFEGPTSALTRAVEVSAAFLAEHLSLTR